MHEVRIAAVDPTDPQTVYLRVLGTDQDALAVTHDGGATTSIAFHAPVTMSAFLRRASGALVVGTRTAGGFVSADRGKTWSAMPGALHVRALAERDGVLYAAADDAADGFALGASDDDGMHWRPVLRFAGICGPRQCAAIQSACTSPWQAVTTWARIPPDVCGLDAPAATLPPVLPAQAASPPRAATHGCTWGGGRSGDAAGVVLGLALLCASRRCTTRRAAGER
jgi:hypothetical protein